MRKDKAHWPILWGHALATVGVSLTVSLTVVPTDGAPASTALPSLPIPPRLHVPDYCTRVRLEGGADAKILAGLGVVLNPFSVFLQNIPKKPRTHRVRVAVSGPLDL